LSDVAVKKPVKKAAKAAKQPVKAVAKKPAAKSAAKPAAKPIAKPAAKKPVAKSAAKPAVKAVTKPVANKPAAKKSAAKPVAKPAVKSVAKKPVAKQAAKPAAKSAPVAKPETKAPIPKPATKVEIKAAAKPASMPTPKPSPAPQPKPAPKPSQAPQSKPAPKAEPAPKSSKPTPRPNPNDQPQKAVVKPAVVIPRPTIGKVAVAITSRPSAPAPKTQVKVIPYKTDEATGRPMLPAGYKPGADEEYMSTLQLEYFRQRLLGWRADLIEESKQTIENLKDEVRDVGDDAERATRETENSLELRTRDRYRKLIGKIDSTLKRVEAGEYGYSVDSGEEIGLHRLEARLTAERTIDEQERWEHLQKQQGD
jgi:DnaK suppressor protein